MKLRLILMCAIALGSPSFLSANEKGGELAGAADVAFFEAKIRPVLVEHCYRCHSAASGKAEGELRVDSRAALRKGGSRGPAVVAGDTKASWLLVAVAHSDPDLRMPPREDRLKDSVLADFKSWIDRGATDPRDVDPPVMAKPRPEFWAKRGMVDHPAPEVVRKHWPLTPIDRFILAKLEAERIAPSPDASPAVLLRRIYFDLTGLPPSTADLDRFTGRAAADGMDVALVVEVDALLATRQFGEHWGRHWLDVARFAESSGKEANISFPYAWRYRDYVIDSVTADVPYNRFLEEQVSGDLLPTGTNAERARLLIATGFLALGPKNLDEGNEAQFQADLVDEQIDTVTRAILANSIACARCHDHKFDPYSMEDYYGLAGIFGSTKTYFGTAVSPSNRNSGDPLRLPDIEGQTVLHASIPKAKVDELKTKLAALNKEEQEKQAAVLKAVAEGRDASGIFTLQDALRIFWSRGGIEGELERVSDDGTALPLAMGVLDRKEIKDSPVYDRGDVARPRELVPRSIPAALRIDGCEAISPDHSGRLEFARWLIHPENPLTARVFVNRVVRNLLGAGLVRSVDNFGSTGEPPTHPELLDHLAVQFVSEGWSLKKLVRSVVLSRTYRQASDFRSDCFEHDPENRLVWRIPKRRLPAEAIRDAMLCASGELDLSRPQGSLVGRVIGDRPISLIGLDRRLPRDLDGSVQRSVYLPVIRDRLPDVLELFDFAEPSLVTGEREKTNVPTQALYLMNSPFVSERSTAMARRLTRESTRPDEQVRMAFQICFARDPLPEESTRVMAFLDSQHSGPEEQKTPPKSLVMFCQALLSTAEFRYVD
ncbi:PSD1 and planctomycete cytochrome C domain-containing protein [Planctomyces sp. SH-PL14]|uniref:PSD1 and planctomycete cytochrome C domain-containing protein n=1 Tax=Planctomyces sp. SH-PL14 TaxID=1632864 RepID=UPI00078DFAF6|nr:PSD1 and planctomycete cytochrome C domain-containing protein [Planctomyces sp. SH-PL14]AMV20133.1 Planctomycete cytochrome C [Planctomyces sp. SH-PL14]